MKKVINLMLSTSLLIASFGNVTSSYSYAENIQKESVENVENKIDLTDPMTSIINQDLSSSDLSDQDTGAYTSSLLHTGNETSYYGGEIINFYNNISVSGNVTRLEEGAHIVISIPKDVFQKPELKNISASYELIKGVEIKETEKDWQIVTTYKEIHGGYNGATPFKINFLEKQIINKSEATVKQEFYDKNENLLAEDSVIVYGKSEIEKPSSSVYSAQRLRNEVDSNYVIKENTYASFNYNSLNKPLENRDDPRDRRVYATIPEGTKVKEGTGWSFDQMNNRYYKDIKRDNVNGSSLKIDLDLSGIDLSAYDSSSKYKTLKVDFSIQPVVDGVAKDDLGPYKWSCERRYYILKEEPSTGATKHISGSKWNKLISKDYDSLNKTYGSGWSNNFSIPYNEELLENQRIRYTYKNISSFYMYNKVNENDPEELTIKSSKINIPKFTDAREFRISIIGNISNDDYNKVKSMLNGTKVYAYNNAGKKILISDNVPVVKYNTYNNSFTNEGWQKFVGGEDFISIEFEYPNGGLVFRGKEEANKFYSLIHS